MNLFVQHCQVDSVLSADWRRPARPHGRYRIQAKASRRRLTVDSCSWELLLRFSKRLPTGRR